MKSQSTKTEDILRAEANKYYEKYLDSPSWVEYCLNYVGNCWNIQTIIVETLCRLPREVKEFACQRCQFVSITEGVCLNLFNTKCKWIIIISEVLDKKDVCKTITINVARAWLHHRSLLDADSKETKDAEEQAIALVTNWGLSEFLADGNEEIS